MTDAVPRDGQRRLDTLLAAACVLLGVALYLTSLRNGFAYDDVPMIARNPFVRELQSLLAYFETSYWGPSADAASAYRPLTVRLWAVEWVLGEGSPVAFHLVNVLLYGVCCGLAYGVARRMLDVGAAAVAALAFTITPLHVEAVANVVGQAELWVFALLASAFVLYVDARESGRFTVMRGVAIVGLYGIALCFKEHAAVLPALLVLWELTLGMGWRRLLRRDGVAARTTVVAMGIPLALFVSVRMHISTDDHPHWDLLELNLPQRAAVMLRLVPIMFRLIVWPDHLSADYSPQFVTAQAIMDADFWIGTAIVVAAAALAVAMRRRAPVVTIGLAWLALAWLPVSNILFPSGVLIAERTLFLPSLGAALALGALSVPLRQALTALPAARTAVLTAVIAVAALGAARVVDRIPVWEDNPAVFAELASDAPLNARAPFALGELNEMGGRPRAADSLYRRALELNPSHLLMRLNYAFFLQAQGRCAEALPILKKLRADFPRTEATNIALTGCHLTLRQYQAGRLAALDGLASGSGLPVLRRLRRHADSLLVAYDSVDSRNRWAREGRPFNRTGNPYIVIVNRGPRAIEAAIGRMQQMTASAVIPP